MSTNVSNYKIHVGDKGTSFQAIMKEELADKTLADINPADLTDQLMEIKRPGHDAEIFSATVVGTNPLIIEYKNTDPAYLDQAGQIKWRGKVLVANISADYFKGEWIVDKVNP